MNRDHIEQLYSSYRQTKTIRESIKIIAKEIGLNRESVCDILGLSYKYAKDL